MATMFSYLSKGSIDIATLICVFISCIFFTTIDANNVEMIQVTQGRDFTLNCPVGNTSNSSNEVDWFHEGNHWNGNEDFRVTSSNLSDGGIYFCNGTTCNKTIHVIIGNKPVEEGAGFELHCKGDTDGSHSQDIFWTKNGKILTNWTGMANLTVMKAKLTDGGVYICNNSGEVTQSSVVVGKIPTLPPTPECLESSNTIIQCKAYPGEFRHAKQICLTVTSIGAWGSRYPVCQNCFTGNKTVTCHVDFDDQFDNDYDITTEVANYAMSLKRTVSYRNLWKKVIPDQPTVVNMTATGLNSFTTWFRIPMTWNKEISIYARGNYTQNGETRMVNESKKYRGQYGKFPFNTVETKPYSLVCWTTQIRYDYGFATTTWSTPSEPVCEYTNMTAPSEKPEELNATFEQDKESPEFRNVTFSWKPPLEEYRNGIIEHYQLVLNREGQNKEVEVRKERIPANFTNITFSGIKSYETFSAKLTAWTQVGQSPPIHVVIDSIPRPTSVKLMLGIAIAIAAISFLIIFGRITWLMRQKVSANHLPEPYFIPEEKMNHCLAQKRLPPQQKEVFDTLKGKTEDSITTICYNHDTSYNACTTPSRQINTPSGSYSGSGSEESQDTSYRSSSGVRCYKLIASTDSALGTDDVFGSNEELSQDSEINSQLSTKTNDYAQAYTETEIGVTNEVTPRPKVITDKGTYGEFGCYDGREDRCYGNGPYVNCNSRVPQDDWSDNGQTLQLCNDTENPEYYIIESQVNDDDQIYQNYTPFKLKVHDTMTKLNGNKEVI